MPENPQYTHSIKIEDTAKGIRISVHVYTNDKATAIEQVFQTYLKVPPRQLLHLTVYDKIYLNAWNGIIFINTIILFVIP